PCLDHQHYQADVTERDAEPAGMITAVQRCHSLDHIEAAMDEVPARDRIQCAADAVADERDHGIGACGKLSGEHSEHHQRHSDEHHSGGVKKAVSVEEERFAVSYLLSAPCEQFPITPAMRLEILGNRHLVGRELFSLVVPFFNTVFLLLAELPAFGRCALGGSGLVPKLEVAIVIPKRFAGEDQQHCESRGKESFGSRFTQWKEDQ